MWGTLLKARCSAAVNASGIASGITSGISTVGECTCPQTLNSTRPGDRERWCLVTLCSHCAAPSGLLPSDLGQRHTFLIQNLFTETTPMKSPSFGGAWVAQ